MLSYDSGPRRTVFHMVMVLLLLAPLLSFGPPASAAGGAILVNFQSRVVGVPVGYYKDYGQPYGLRSEASQGSGLTYGWVSPADGQPLDLSNPGNGRDRGFSGGGLDQRLDTFIHMQYDDVVPTGSGTPIEGAWEIELPAGLYDVNVSVGDAQTGPTERHSIRVEGMPLIQDFVSSGPAASSTRFAQAGARVSLSDGRLTVDAQGGFNTKIAYIDILPVTDPTQPYITGVMPRQGASGVLRSAAVTTTVSVPNGGIDAATINGATVKLLRSFDQVEVAATVNTTGGGDAITLQPSTYLDPDTQYTFIVTDGVQDVTGRAFLPFTSTFSTGTAGGPGSSTSAISFDVSRGLASNMFLSSLAIGPDGKLYAASLTGDIYRYTIAADGSLSGEQTISTVATSAGGPRSIIGLRFDPAATADSLILWVSHNAPYVDAGATGAAAEDWTGRIGRLSGPDLATFQDYVVGLPRSTRDHMVNSIDFGPDGALYVAVGSNTAMGAPDDAWGNRPERLLSAAILRVDTSLISSPPLDVKTDAGGSYNPFAPGAPLTIYASGVRNAYDLVWHSNGQLYAPANGSAAGGNGPASPTSFDASTAACQSRVDSGLSGAYTGPVVPAFQNGDTENDWLFRVVQGGYYGHPNPARCEWVMNGGNPTGGVDSAEVPQYPVGTLPDRNYRGFAYIFGPNKSPDGAIEYKSNSFNGELKGKLLVTRWSQEDDILVLEPGGAANDIVGVQSKLPGLTSFSNPLDLVEDTRNGNLYLIEFSDQNPSQIDLLRPASSTAPRIQVAPDTLIFTDKAADSIASASQAITISNIGQTAMTVQSVTLAGAGAGSFQLKAPLPTSVAAGGSAEVRVSFNPTAPGPQLALARIVTDAANGGTVEVLLRGLGTLGFNGANEPSLQWILDAYQITVNVGDDDPSTAVIHSQVAQQKAALLGEEIGAQRFLRADNATPVTIEPLAVFGPTSSDPVTQFGWYPSGSATVKHQIFAVSNTPSTSGQRINPPLNPGASLIFDPGSGAFGFYSTWPYFSNRTLYSEDSLNTFAGAIPHHVRVYPLKDDAGALVPNAYVVATEETTSGIDFQDVVVVVRNVKPAIDAAPSVSAGADQTVGTGGQVQLGGSASSPSGRPMSFAWSQLGGAPVTLSGADTLQPSFTAPGTAQTLTFRLTVSDALFQVQDTVVVTVQGTPLSGMRVTSSSPTVLGQATTFSANLPAGLAGVTLAWDFGDGGSGSGAAVSHTYAAEGTYVAALTASKSGYPNVTASLQVTVTNAAPTANAGASRSVAAGATVTLDASASRDSDGHTPLSFSWSQLSGTPVALSGASTARPTFTAPQTAGAMVFRVTVSDSYQKRGHADVTITVGPAQVGGLTKIFLPLLVTPPSAAASAPAGILFARSRAASLAAATGPRLTLVNPDKLPYDDWLSFSRVELSGVPQHYQITLEMHNSGDSTLTIPLVTISGPDAASFTLSGYVGPFNIAPGAFKTVLVKFVSGANPLEKGLRRAVLSIPSNDPTVPTKEVTLTGYNQVDIGGNLEPTLPDLLNVFGYGTKALNPGEKQSFAAGALIAVGDEVISSDGRWVRASLNAPIYVRQIIAYSGEAQPKLFVGGSFIQHGLKDWHTILPQIDSPLSPRPPTEMTVSLNNPFAFNVAGYSTTDPYTGANGGKHSMRMYALRDRSGGLVANTYILALDYTIVTGANFDYQDNVWLVTNVRPAAIADNTNNPAPLPGAPQLVLEFDRSTYPGTLVDGSGQTTGFPATQRNRFDITAPHDPPRTSYDASRLTLATGGAGTLTIATNPGSNQGTDNTQVNAMCLPFDGRSGGALIRTRLLGPLGGLSMPAQQGGLIFGPSQSNFIRIAAVAAGGGQVNLHFSQEIAGVPTDLIAPIALGAGSAISSLDLQLIADPATGIISGAYQLNGGPPQALGGQAELSGEAYGRFFSATTAACILASHTGATSTSLTFDRLAVLPLAQPSGGTVIQRYNIGGPTVTIEGETWQTDAGRFSPATAPSENQGAPAIYVPYRDATPTDGDRTDDGLYDVLYQTYRGNVGNLPQDQRIITYTFPLATSAPATVAARLHFAEIYWGNNGPAGPARRVFDVYAEGQLVLKDFDPYAAAGGPLTAVVATTPSVLVSDGALTIEMRASIDYAALAAVEILDGAIAPVADAGPDRSALTNELVRLDAGQSFDPDSTTPLSFAWQQLSGPAVSLTGADTATPSFTAPATAAVLLFVVRVTDSQENAASDQVQVTVDAPQAVERSPVADAGPDQEVGAGGAVTLDGSGSSHPDGLALSYAWAQLSGPSVSLTGAMTASPRFTAPDTAGVLVFRLTVTASNGRTASDQVAVVVTQAPAPRSPVANAGPDQAVGAGGAVTLDGSGSSHPDGLALSYAWAQLSGPSVSLTGATTASPRFTAPDTAGTLVFRLTVTASNGQTASDQVAVVVTQAPAPRSPVANAGPDQEVGAGGAVTLDGSGSSHPDGLVLSYAWAQLSGPSVSLTGATTASPRFTAPDTAGVLVFRLTVTASNGRTASDQVAVVVTPGAAPDPTVFRIYLPLLQR